MSDKPPPIPLKYKVATPEELPQPRHVVAPPRKKPRTSHWEAVFRVMIVLVILVSVAVAYWSFFQRLQPLQRKARSMLTTVSATSARLDQMERRWPPDQIREMRAQYREVYTLLFADSAALEEWLGEIQAQAAPLALELDVDFGQAVPQGGFTTNLSTIPVSISLEVLPSPGETLGKSPYERVLVFGQQLAAQGKRADLAELNVTGGEGSVSHALMVFNLWAGDLEAEAEAATNNVANPPAK